jgi:hypothetical protein
MRRAQAILAILVLLSAPLSLLAGSNGSEMAACDGMCCMPHHGAHHTEHHSEGSHPLPQKHNHESESCEHGSNGDLPKCTIGCEQAPTDYSYVSPINPTKPSSLASISQFDAPQFAKLRAPVENLAAGFRFAPFQPPRA